ncbi:hypothetical protein HMPREF3196_01541 [Bifidobacterium bifidum]|uniref:Uncharacterized protein n=1 Tax=Bifidobacterium bifidum TaxID=1681 RepID=A0A133KMJ3_BIFBI|nr:hypothetical protein HMPREF3196_01541 [Bifidobacterium bifidum]
MADAPPVNPPPRALVDVCGYGRSTPKAYFVRRALRKGRIRSINQ